MGHGLKLRRWLFAGSLIIAILFGLAWQRSGPTEPVYQGRRLRNWLDGHPREYHPAVRAVGTNALPFLLGELQTVDSAPSRFVQRLLNQIDAGPLWRTARTRRYHARLALQILDTNAAPALVEMVLAHPVQPAEGDPGWGAAFALTWLASPEANRHVQERLAQAMRSPDSILRRNAVLAFTVGLKPSDENARLIADLTRDPDTSISTIALRVLPNGQRGGTNDTRRAAE